MPNDSLTHDAKDYRVAVFGAAGVGKSSLVQRFVNGTYKETYIPTVEDTYRKVSQDRAWVFICKHVFITFMYMYLHPSCTCICNYMLRVHVFTQFVYIIIKF